MKHQPRKGLRTFSRRKKYHLPAVCQQNAHPFSHTFSASFRLRGKFRQLTFPFEVLRERHMVAELTVCHANDKLGTGHDKNFAMWPCTECISGQLHLFTNGWSRLCLWKLVCSLNPLWWEGTTITSRNPSVDHRNVELINGTWSLAEYRTKIINTLFRLMGLSE